MPAFILVLTILALFLLPFLGLFSEMLEMPFSLPYTVIL
jgi:hypothetical protein